MDDQDEDGWTTVRYGRRRRRDRYFQPPPDYRYNSNTRRNVRSNGYKRSYASVTRQPLRPSRPRAPDREEPGPCSTDVGDPTMITSISSVIGALSGTSVSNRTLDRGTEPTGDGGGRPKPIDALILDVALMVPL